ncbi:MAG: sugar phosphate isomerase/epimerase [Magnetospirillum sp. WYHS-4]
MTTAERVPEASLIHRGLGRVEFFDLTDAEIAGLDGILSDLAGEGRRAVSFHVPVHRPDWFPQVGVTCYFLSEDAAKRERSFRLVEHTLDLAERFGAEYLVTHLTFGPTDTHDPVRARDLAVEACARFARLSRERGLPIDVEFAAYTDSYNDPATFAAAVTAHPELGLCIDVGHTFLGALKRERDFLGDIRVLAPHARSLHLWNSTGPEHTRLHHHTPLHPSQHPRDGWIDLAAVMEIVLVANPRPPKVIFEYPVAEVTPEIQAGYDWVAGMMGARIP